MHAASQFEAARDTPPVFGIRDRLQSTTRLLGERALRHCCKLNHALSHPYPAALHFEHVCSGVRSPSVRQVVERRQV